MTRTPVAMVIFSVLVILIPSVLAGGMMNYPLQDRLDVTAAEVDAKQLVDDGEPEVEFRQIVVRGICTDDNGETIEGVQIRVYRYTSLIDEPLLTGEGTSNAMGFYEIKDVETAIQLDDVQYKFDLMIAFTKPDHAANLGPIYDRDETVIRDVHLKPKSSGIFGLVKDWKGNPISGATVTTQILSEKLIPGIHIGISDSEGRYEIDDISAWKPEDTRRRNGSGYEQTSGVPIYIQHPDFPRTRVVYAGAPAQIDITLEPASIVEGQLIDDVTGEPLADHVVSAQGVHSGDWFQMKTDKEGRYRLALTRDLFNLWSTSEDRIAVACANVDATPEQVTSGVDIHMVSGGFVVGRVVDSQTGKTFFPAKGQTGHIGCHGPARPPSGSGVHSTEIEEDGSFRLRVAPGRNFVYFMTAPQPSAIVDVKEGEEVQLELRFGDKADVRELPDYIERNPVRR